MISIVIHLADRTGGAGAGGSAGEQGDPSLAMRQTVQPHDRRLDPRLPLPLPQDSAHASRVHVAADHVDEGHLDQGTRGLAGQQVHHSFSTEAGVKGADSQAAQSVQISDRLDVRVGDAVTENVKVLQEGS